MFILANLLSFSGGMVLTWSSPVLPKLENESQVSENPLGRTISKTEASWLGSTPSIGDVMSPFLAVYLADKFGKKKILTFIGIPYVISHITLAFAGDIALYYFARILGGVALGFTYAVVPRYVAEISEKNVRGILGSFINIFLTLGSLASYSIGPFVSIRLFGIISSVVPAVCILLCMLIPESPYLLVKIGKEAEAANVLKQIRKSTDKKAIDDELNEIKNFINTGSKTKITDLFTKKANLKALIVTTCLFVFQQFSGISAVIYYAENLFSESGSSISPEVAAILLGVAQVVATTITLLFVDRFGRKTLLFVSAVGMFLSEVSLAVYFYLEGNQSLQWMPVACLMIFMATHNFGFAPVPWVILSEIFGEGANSIAIMFVSSFDGVLSFLVTFLYSPLSEALGMSGLFFLFSTFNVLAIGFIFLYVPETKAKSLKEIQEKLARQKPNRVV